MGEALAHPEPPRAATVPPPCTEPLGKQDLRIQGLAAAPPIAPHLSYFHNPTSRCLAALTRDARQDPAHDGRPQDGKGR